jgi:aspartyl-tRNA(Asn)/glutamyl-tRNA(Gln) amidotransferase subunit B
MFRTRRPAEEIIEEKGLKPIDDTAELERILDQVLMENPKVVAKVKAGKTKPIDFLIGQVMKKTKGRADPKRVRELVDKTLLI